MKLHKKKKRKKPLNELTPRVETELFGHDDQPVDAWRIFKIMAEFVNGFELLRKYNKRSATFFGSARCDLDDTYYKQATALARRLSENGYTIITGGASGIMEAANKGAHEAGGASVGLNIKLPKEQGTNKYISDSMEFHYFFSRKVMLSFASEVYVYFPGGFGTMDEFFEIVTLIQTKKVKPVPIVLVGRDFWEPLLKWFETSLLKKYKTINSSNLQIFHLTDSVDEAYDLIIELVDTFCEKYSC